MRHVYECPLRWGDMDMLGHVNNVTYVDYLQEARIDMFAAHAGFSGVQDLAEGVVVVRHEVEFVRPLVFHRAPVKVEVWVTEVRAGSFTLAYEVFDDLLQEKITEGNAFQAFLAVGDGIEYCRCRQNLIVIIFFFVAMRVEHGRDRGRYLPHQRHFHENQRLVDDCRMKECETAPVLGLESAP